MKKAQVTLFIILGIVLLIILAIAIYFATQIIIKPKAPTTEHAIKIYVQDCIKETAVTALKKIGDNGGYIDIENPYRDFNIKTEPTEGDALVISELGLYPIPYWWYMKTTNKCNNCYLTTDNMPLIPEIEEQINEHVLKNVGKCLKNLSTFSQYEITTGEMDVITNIAKDSILITAEYPVEFSRGEIKTKITEFETEIRISFKKIYDLAKEIIELEKTKAIIEERIMHMITAHSGARYDKLPPISEITHDYYVVQWTKPLVEMQIKQILNSYMPLLRFSRTKNARDVKVDNKYAKGFYNAMQIEDLQEKYDLFVDFSYNDWPIYFDINPKPLTGSTHKQSFEYDLMAPFQTNTYEFYYDLSVPVLVQIRDSSALGGNGYTLNFAVESNIRDNKNPIEWNLGQGTLGPWTGEKANLETTTQERTQGNCVSEEGKYKCDLNNKKYDTLQQCSQICYTTSEKKEKVVLLKTEFCSSEQKLSGEIKIKVRSGSEAISNAGISYACGNYKTCTIGVTDSTGILSSKLPICYGGIISAHKQGYLAEKKILTTGVNKAETIEFNLQKEKEFTVDFKIRPIKTEQTAKEVKKTCCDSIKNPLSTQKALLSLERIKETPGAAEFMQAVIIDEGATIKLIPGKYKVNIQYTDDIGIIIPAECKKICVDYEIPPEEYAEAVATDILTLELGGTDPKAKCKEYKYLPEENIALSPAPLGGAVFEWTVTEQDLADPIKNINFYVLEIPTPACLDNQCIYGYCNGLDELSKTEAYSKEFREFIEPKFG